MNDAPPLAAVVLCGGRSRRMGTDKALIPVGAEPLVHRVAGRLASAADPVLIAPGVPGRLGPMPYREVGDACDGCGPIGGIVAALEASPHELLAVVAVDMPFADAALFGLLARSWAGEHAVIPVTERGPEPLHAIYAKAALPRLRRAVDDGRFAMHDAVETLHVRRVPPDEWLAGGVDARFALNLNSPEDLETAVADGT